MKKRLVHLILPVITLILEIIPYGAVLNFKRPTDTGEIVDSITLYSYFDTMAFAWGNIAPMITGIFTCISLLFVIAYCMKGKNRTAIVARKLLLVTAVINLCPLFYGVKYLSLVAILVTASLVTEAVLLTREIKNDSISKLNL